jgi:inosine/xanthosine triphosphate pyrophosphatase family protein
MERVVLATHNPGKASEMAALLAPYGVACVSAGELGLPEPEETETSFAGNARLKALAAARMLLLQIDHARSLNPDWVLPENKSGKATSSGDG